MAPESRPWWRVDADTDESDKLASLPSDAARWAWFRTMCRAKTQRRMGVFGGEKHLRTLLGTHGRYVPDLVRVGVIHVWPAKCERCKADYADVAGKDELVVHDYRRKQRDPTAADRQASRRLQGADSHADVTPESRDSHADVTPISRAGMRGSPALSPSLSMSPSDQSSGEPYQVSADIVEPYRTLEELTRFPVQRVGRTCLGRLDGLSDRRGVDAVVASMRARASAIETQPPSPEQLVMAVQKHLEPYDHTPAGRNGSKPKGHQPTKEDVDAVFD